MSFVSSRWTISDDTLPFRNAPVTNDDSVESNVRSQRFDAWESVWQQVDFGFGALDCYRHQLVCLNSHAEAMLRAEGISPSYEVIQNLIQHVNPRPLLQQADNKRREIIIGEKIIGFTLYRGSPGIVVVLLQDITEKRRLEAVAEAANLTDNLGYVFAGIRHELGNPLNSMKVALQVLQRNLNIFSMDTIAEYLGRIGHEVKRIEDLLAGLRTFSMFDKIKPCAVHLPTFVEHFAALICRDLDSQGIELTTHLGPGVDWVLADHRALHQVLLNVFTNSMDACKDQLNSRIELRVTSQGQLVQLVVEDNGRGLQGTIQNELFKPFRTTKPNGTGLGLVITRKLLAAMQGTISLTNGETAGARTTIVLPKAQPHVQDQARERSFSDASTNTKDCGSDMSSVGPYGKRRRGSSYDGHVLDDVSIHRGMV